MPGAAGLRTRGLAPSIIAADMLRLGEALDAVAEHADRWHIDVMDGHHVPNLTIGPTFVKAISERWDIIQDVHLMVTNPDETWKWYADHGAERIVFHPEQSPDALELLRQIREAGYGAGIAVNPEVSVAQIAALTDDVDLIVVMSVHPGFSGQRFITDALPKLRELRADVDDRVELVIDGGVNLETAPGCVDAGADVLVSASAVFGADDPPAVAAKLRGLARGGVRTEG